MSDLCVFIFFLCVFVCVSVYLYLFVLGLVCVSLVGWCNGVEFSYGDRVHAFVKRYGN